MVDWLDPVAVCSLDAETWSTPLLDAGRGLIVAVDRSGSLQAFGLDGRSRWMRPLGGLVTASPMAVEVGRPLVVLGEHGGRLVACDRRDGTIVWERKLGGRIRASCAVSTASDGLPVLFAASYGDHLVCLDAADGRVRWRRWLPPHLWARMNGVVSSPMVADIDGDGRREVVIGTRSWRTYCLDAESGRLRWWRGFDYGVDSTASVLPARDGAGLVFVGTGESLNGRGDNAVVALDARTGALCWRREVGGGVDASTTLWTGPDGRPRAFQPSLADASLHCLDALSGDVLWVYRLTPTEDCRHNGDNVCIGRGRPDYFTEDALCRCYTTPLVADLDGDGRAEVVIGSNNGRLVILDAQTGEERALLALGGLVRGSPVAADLDGDGRLELVVTSGAELHVFRTAAVEGAWPCFKGSADLTGAVRLDPPSEADRRPRPAARRRRWLEEARLLWQWTAGDLGYYVRTRVDKKLLEPLGLARMDYRY